MAKSGQKRHERVEPTPPAANASLLSEAVKAYERGDMARTRDAARRALSGDASAPAPRAIVGRVFSGEGPARTVGDVATELLARSEVPRQTYLFALLVAALFAAMILLALTRT